MAWSGPFRAACANRTGAVLFIFRTAPMHDEPVYRFTVASVAGLGYDVRIAESGVQIGGSRLSPRGWSTSIGAWSVDITGDLDFTQYLTRGSIVELLAGFEGWAAADFEIIALGQVRNVRGQPPRWTIEIHDLFAATTQPLLTSSALAGSALFSNVEAVPPIATTLSVAYVVGDATVNVASTADFPHKEDGSGAIKITPNAGDPFYLTYTGSTGTTFTGCSAAAIYGTTAGAAAIGNAVAHIVYMHNDPLHMLRLILCSGGRLNSVYTSYPDDWGLRIDEAYVDHEDIDLWRIALDGNGAIANYRWKIIETAAQTDAYAYLTAKMALFGLFFAIRQGLLTIRAGQASVNGSAGVRISAGIDITDDDIAEVLEYEAFEVGHTPEYNQTYMTNTGDSSTRTYTSLTAADTATLPRSRVLTYNTAGLIRESNAQTDLILEEICERVEESSGKVPERASLRLVTLRCAQLTVGDAVRLTTTRVHSRRDGSAGFDRRECIVDEVIADWCGWTTQVGLLIYPESENAFA